MSIGDQADVKVGFVDLARGTWHIPLTKNQRSHTIHLSEFARTQFQILETLRMRTSDKTASLSPWVFSDGSTFDMSSGQKPAELAEDVRSMGTRRDFPPS